MVVVVAVNRLQIQCAGYADQLQAELAHSVVLGESSDVHCILKLVEPGSEGLPVLP